MKNLIAELREMGGRLRPEAADALEQQVDLNLQQAAVIEQMTTLLNKIHDTAAPYDDGVKFRYIKEMALEALALQPCPEVLNKVKADVREICDDTDQEYEPVTGEPRRLNYSCERAIRETAKS